MYVEKIDLRNYGPIEEFIFEPSFDKDGNPFPVILMGQNGAGKTLVLSNILHSIVEFKRKKYDSIQEVSDDNFYRVGSLNYINTNALTAYNRLEYSDGAIFTEVMTKKFSAFEKEYDDKIFPGVVISDSKLKKTGFYSNVIAPDENVFEKEIFMFFPVDRYYIPTWENKSNTGLTYITNEQNFIGKSSSNMVKYNIMRNVEEWLLDVIIDKELYERSSYRIDKNGGVSPIYSGKNSNIQGVINSMLSILYKNKGYDSARIAVTERRRLYRQIKIVGQKAGNEYEIMPSMTNVSSGEAMVIGIMASILREADRISHDRNMNIKKIKGIVLIDEIDAHLHSDLLQNALPALIELFSGIQFIVSSHSPFSLLGMRDQFGEKCSFVALPSGSSVGDLIDFQEIKNFYNTVNSSYLEVLNDYRRMQEEINAINRPLIVTEGKTDWKHLKNALIKLKEKGKYLSLDIDFLEYDYDMGADKLDSLLERLSMIPHIAPIIGVFDDDSARGKKYVTSQNIGNNVFACSITDTQGYGCEISIELLYPREDLVKIWPDKRRLYLSDEFSEKSHQLIANPYIVSQNKTIADAHKRKIIKVVDSEVFNEKEKSLAVSKEEFAKRVLENKAPYKNVNVNGFEPIFDKFERILNESR